jgi:hypothetical protein
MSTLWNSLSSTFTSPSCLCVRTGDKEDDDKSQPVEGVQTMVAYRNATTMNHLIEQTFSTCYYLRTFG